MLRTKQFAISSGIAVLLPFLTYYTVELFGPPPTYDHHSNAYMEDLSEEESKGEDIKGEESKEEKERIKQEDQRRKREFEEKVKNYQRLLFFVAYTVGILAIIIGFIIPVRAVGEGLMFGGLATLAEGCYIYWDQMQRWGRFISLLVALAVLIVLGFLRLRPVVKDEINDKQSS